MISKKDCEGMRYNPFAFTMDTMIWDYYPDFKVRSYLGGGEFGPSSFAKMGIIDHKRWKAKMSSLVIRFVILFIDTESPFFKERDLERRKAAVLDLLNIKEGSLVYKNIMEESSYYQSVVHAYFVLLNNIDYEHWFTVKKNYHNFTKHMRNDSGNLSGNEKINLTKQIESFRMDVIIAEDRIYNDPKLKEIINRKATEESIFGYPEKYAHKI